MIHKQPCLEDLLNDENRFIFIVIVRLLWKCWKTARSAVGLLAILFVLPVHLVFIPLAGLLTSPLSVGRMSEERLICAYAWVIRILLHFKLNESSSFCN